MKSYHNLTIFCIKVSILNFSKECHYLENKVGVVDFTKARGMVKFQSPRALAGPWALKHYHSLGICKIYYSHFIFEVMYHCFENECTFKMISLSGLRHYFQRIASYARGHVFMNACNKVAKYWFQIFCEYIGNTV